MKVVRTVAEFRSVRPTVSTVGFVPTMGSFHDGHLQLMRFAKEANDVSVVSIFVNPTQFGPREDFDRYPRDEERDLQLALEANVDYVFAPTVDEMYAEQGASVRVGPVADEWEGAMRPGHFDGVATVVLKLLEIVRPTTAYFGLKDLQQCAVVKTLVRSFNLDTKLGFVETVREPTGLARSSRNDFLSVEQRTHASVLYKFLNQCADHIKIDSNAVSSSLEKCKDSLVQAGFQPDYVALVDPETMASLQTLAPCARIIAAVKLAGIRLIDNVAVEKA